jgi:hypothetical protein
MGARFARHELLHQPVLEGVEGHDDESAAGAEPPGRLFEDKREFFKLLIDENP